VSELKEVRKVYVSPKLSDSLVGATLAVARNPAIYITSGCPYEINGTHWVFLSTLV